MKRIILRMAFALGLLIASVAIAALMGYASSMIVLMLNLCQYGEYIMCGVFIVSAIVIFATNIGRVDKLTESRVEEPAEKMRDYFKDGNFSQK